MSTLMLSTHLIARKLLDKAALSNPEGKLKTLRGQLYNFACAGLRTLVVAKRELDDSVWKSWNQKYQAVGRGTGMVVVLL